ncbi:MAG: riboflavin synthase [Gammaproteobacteria bacterium]|nr:riboflavin synthase [Gammaproteobacteria bacterium]
MFSGIVRTTGRVAAASDSPRGRRLRFEAGESLAKDISPGASLCVSGVCLTAAECNGAAFTADVSAETLSCTTLGGLRVGDAVNLEPALAASARLDGHFVSGHVDGVGEITACDDDGESRRLAICFPETLARYLARKGAVCVDGVSLTVNEVGASDFSVNVIPFTLAQTTLSSRRAGDAVNIEVDLLARYLERLMEAR